MQSKVMQMQEKEASVAAGHVVELQSVRGGGSWER